MTELLAVLSISAAAGFRLALPLLMIGLMSESLWSQVPILSMFPPTIVVGALVSWTLAELVFSKERIIQRLFQSVELFLSPLVGAIAGITIARTFSLEGELTPLLGILGGLLALVIHLVQVGWLYRLRTPSIWLVVAADLLCVCLVLLAFDAPHQGGLIALLLLWLALRTSSLWRNWYVAQAEPRHRKRPRYLKRNPD
ncbi:MAG: DUF4126 domain-containing protein [Leptolyngbya sp. SIO1E4]|nr:DUF4126 domain-containing protein [Leptolyngbya sp. SIO1E4]